MLAWASVALLLLEFAFYAFVGAALLSIEGWLKLVGFCLLSGVAVRLALTLFTFFVAAQRAGERPVQRPSRGALAALIMRELLASIAAFCVLQPMERWLGIRRAPGAADSDTPPVLLVHGYTCNAGIWYPMVRALKRRGITRIYTLNLEPIFGGVDGYAEQVAALISELRTDGAGDGLVIIGHSMGGLVGRAFLARHDPEGRVAKLVTLGSPNHGTVLAELSTALSCRQMRVNSEWLKSLAAAERERLHPARLTTILSYDDNLIAPRVSGSLAGAKDLRLVSVGHIEMPFSKRIEDLLYQEITS